MNKKNIAKRRETLHSDFQIGCSAVGANDLLIQCKIATKKVTLMRRKVALFLRERGHTMEDIGMVMHRHHSTIVNTIRKAKQEHYHTEEVLIRRKIKWVEGGVARTATDHINRTAYMRKCWVEQARGSKTL